MKTLLITGATGDVGTHMRRELAGKYRLRAVRQAAAEEPAEGRELHQRRHCKDGRRDEDHQGRRRDPAPRRLLGRRPWEDILQANIVGCYNVFEAARRNGVKRILFATSNHAVGFYRRDETIDHRVYPKPDSRYGVSKVFGEALGSLYADKYGMEVFCMRIGNVNERPIDKRRLADLAQPARLAQLVHDRHRASRTSGSRSSTASPATSARWYDNSNALRLGYRPQDDSEVFAAEVLARNEKPGDPVRKRTRAACSAPRRRSESGRAEESDEEGGEEEEVKRRVALVGLGMAVTPHAKSLVDLKDRVAVAYAFSPSAQRRAAFASRFDFQLTDKLETILDDGRSTP